MTHFRALLQLADGEPSTMTALELVLRIEMGGGHVIPSFIVGRIPELSVFGDGRVIVLGPRIAIFGADAHYDHPGTADAGTTTFTVVAEGRRHVISADALSEAGALDAQLEPDVRRARAALSAFQQRVLDMRSWLGRAIIEPEAAYRYQSLRVFVTAAQPQEPADLEPSFADWPLATPLAAFGAPLVGFAEMGCGVVTGNELEALRAALENSNQLTFWRSEGATYQLTPRPLLPDESGCLTGL